MASKRRQGHKKPAPSDRRPVEDACWLWEEPARRAFIPTDDDLDLDNPSGFTCPRCGATSHHPQDAAEGYCGACHDWTGRCGE